MKYLSISRVIFAVATLGWMSLSLAGEFDRVVTITKILPIAGERPAFPQSRNVIRIYVNEASWGTSTCRQDAADLLALDKHLVSVLLTAWASGRQVTMAVDDSLHPVDTVCQIVWLSAQ